MKKTAIRIIALLLVLPHLLVVALANPVSLSNEQLYDRYASIVAEANQKYGTALELNPFDEIEKFIPAEEFEEDIIQYCESKKNGLVVTYNMEDYPATAAGVGVVTVPNSVSVTYTDGTVTATFYGTFEIRQRTSGSYYVYDESYRVYTSSTSSKISYAVHGSPSVNVYDSGRSRTITQMFDVSIHGYVEETTSLKVGYYVSPATGAVSTVSV